MRDRFPLKLLKLFFRSGLFLLALAIFLKRPLFYPASDLFAFDPFSFALILVVLVSSLVIGLKEIQLMGTRGEAFKWYKNVWLLASLSFSFYLLSYVLDAFLPHGSLSTAIILDAVLLLGVAFLIPGVIAAMRSFGMLPRKKTFS